VTSSDPSKNSVQRSCHLRTYSFAHSVYKESGKVAEFPSIVIARFFDLQRAVLKSSARKVFPSNLSGPSDKRCLIEFRHTFTGLSGTSWATEKIEYCVILFFLRYVAVE
jgi:hypothetical protein